MSKGLVNWEFAADGQHGSVFPVDAPVDGETVFATFAEARSALSDHFLAFAVAYRDAARDARRLRKGDVEKDFAERGTDAIVRAVF